MSDLRLVIVTPRFWPLLGGTTTALRYLAAGLLRQHCRVKVLTARWQAAWPEMISLGGVDVVRLHHAPRSAWETFRWVHAAAGWLRRRRNEFDLIFVSGLRHEALAALLAVGRGMPVVLRAQRAGPAGDCAWQQSARLGGLTRRLASRVAGIVAPSAAIERELLAAGYAADRVRLIGDGVPLPPPRTRADRAAARAALAAAHVTFELPEHAPLALYTGQLTRQRGLDRLVAAWRRLADRWTNARLWLAGVGPDRLRLQQQIAAANLTGRVLPLGGFDGVDALLAAADMAVVPDGDHTCMALREAMAAGLPVVAADTPAHQAIMQPEQEGVVAAADDPAAWAAALDRLMSRPEWADSLAAAARQRAAADFSLEKTVAAHQSLFASLLTDRAHGHDPM